jgi:hypothetical protein
MPDPREAMDTLDALAMTGATTVVAAMATDAWRAVRDRIAQLFHRHGYDRQAIEAQLDGDAQLVELDEDADGARQDVVAPWKRRLTALLREFPEAQADLADLIDRVRDELPAAGQTWIQANLARDHGIVNAVQHGNQYTFYMDAGYTDAGKSAGRVSAESGEPDA